MPANRIVALGSALAAVGAFLLPILGVFENDIAKAIVAATALIVFGAVAVMFLRGWSNWETAETVAQTAVITAAAAGAQVPGLSEGVKAEGFEPPVEAP
jgi:uncharacterized membrane protein